MKKMKIVYLLLIVLALQSCCIYCDDDDIGLPPDSTSAYDPVFLNRTAFENSVALQNPVAIGITGKIYVKGDLLFINELNKGFHVFDNSDPSNPIAIKFLEAPGSTDMAIRSDIIYINQATDLIAINYNASKNSVEMSKRIANTFPPLRSPDGFDSYDIPENSVLIDWNLKN